MEEATYRSSAELVERLRGKYRVPITDGLGPAGGEEPDNPNEFVRTFETPPIQHAAAQRIEDLESQMNGWRDAAFSWQEAFFLPDNVRRGVYLSILIRDRGSFSRNDLVSGFGVSEATATLDIKKWMEDNPGKAAYDKSKKRYRRT